MIKQVLSVIRTHGLGPDTDWLPLSPLGLDISHANNMCLECWVHFMANRKLIVLQHYLLGNTFLRINNNGSLEIRRHSE